MKTKIPAPKYSLQNVNVMLAEPRTGLRQELIKNLKEIGLTQIEATGNLNKVHKSLADGGMDLLICDTVLPEGDLKELIKSVRFGQTTSDPFMVIIALVSNPTAEILQEMMDCGPDAILVKPFSPDQLQLKIESLVNNRKRFAVTSSYIGPERRRGHRQDTIGKETIRVPNPLYNKAFGIEKLGVTLRATKVAGTRINTQLVESQSGRVVELISELFGSTSQLKWSQKKLKDLDELREITLNINRLIQETEYRSLSGLITTLFKMLETAKDWTREENAGDLHLLAKLSEVLQRGFSPTDYLTAETVSNTVAATEKNAASPHLGEKWL